LKKLKKDFIFTAYLIFLHAKLVMKFHNDLDILERISVKKNGVFLNHKDGTSELIYG
jgi:hypothetical protein